MPPILSRLKRLFLKLLWFFVVAVLEMILFGGIIQVIVSLSGKELTWGYTVAAIILATAVQALLLVAFVWGLRKNHNPLIRWTRRSIAIQLPLLVIGVAIIIVFSFHVNKPPAGRELVSQSGGLNAITGNQRYVDGLEFDNVKLLELTNTSRKGNGLPALALDESLNTSAVNKCKDLVTRNYWSHNDPDGKAPWHFITETGYSYDTAGENLAYGFLTENDVVKGWMKSPGHRANILNTQYTQVGFGTCKGDNYMGEGRQLVVVQHLAKPYVAPPNVTRKAAAQKPYVAPVCTKTPIPYETVYEDVNYMFEGETSSYGGYEGYTQTCTADSTGYKPQDYTISPISKTVLVGTKVREVPTTESQ